MSQKEIKKLYDSLLHSGDLLEEFPNMTGEWKKDKKEFTDQYMKNEEILNQDILDLDDTEEDQFLDDQNLIF